MSEIRAAGRPNMGPWTLTESGAEQRVDAEGTTFAIIRPPGGADEGRWGWWGHDGQRSDGGKAQSQDEARRLADAAAPSDTVVRDE